MPQAKRRLNVDLRDGAYPRKASDWQSLIIKTDPDGSLIYQCVDAWRSPEGIALGNAPPTPTSGWVDHSSASEYAILCQNGDLVFVQDETHGVGILKITTSGRSTDIKATTDSRRQLFGNNTCGEFDAALCGLDLPVLVKFVADYMINKLEPEGYNINEMAYVYVVAPDIVRISIEDCKAVTSLYDAGAFDEVVDLLETAHPHIDWSPTGRDESFTSCDDKTGLLSTGSAIAMVISVLMMTFTAFIVSI